MLNVGGKYVKPKIKALFNRFRSEYTCIRKANLANSNPLLSVP